MRSTCLLLHFGVLLATCLLSAQTDQTQYGIAPTELSEVLLILLGTLTQPVRVTALVCWDKRDTMLFVGSFHEKFIERNSYTLLVVSVDNLSFPRNIQDEHHELILLDVGCERKSIHNLFNKSSEQLKRHYKWVLVDTRFKDTDVLQLMNNQPILPRSEIYNIKKLSKEHYEYSKLYRITPYEPIIQESYGAYVNGSFQKYLKLTSLEKRRNLHGKKQFRCTTILRDPRTLETYRNYTNLSVDTYLKTTIWLLVELLQYANASMTIDQTETYGNFNKTTGKWTHLFGKFQERLTDVALAPIFIIHERVSMLQYMVSTHVLDAYFLFRRPNLAVTDNIFLASFDRRVWMCTILLIILLVAVLAGMIFYERKREDRKAERHLAKPVEVSDSLVLVIGAACQQGSSHLPQSPTSRLVIICCFISLMFLFTSYSACIVVLLQSPSNKIQTMQHLYDSRFKLGLHQTTWNVQVFKIQTDPFKKAVYDNRIKNSDGTSNLFSIEEGMQRVRDGSVALHLEETVAYEQVSLKFMDSEKCALKSIQYLHKPEPHISMVKNSSYYEIIRVGMLRLMEHGIANRHYRRIYTTKPDCTGRIAMFTSATLLDTLPAFIIIAWGFVGALGILLCEKLYTQFGHRFIHYVHKNDKL